MCFRGHPHIHGMAWSRMEELEKKYCGLQMTFQKLKQRERLSYKDIVPLQKFVDATVTCTTDVNELKKIFHPIESESQEGNENCQDECDPEKCVMCAELCAEQVRHMVINVNTHHHTKTCGKKKPGCRFGIPRPPSDFTIIAQAMPEEMKKVEEKTVQSLEFVMGKVKTELKRIEDDLIQRKRDGNTNAEIEGTLDSMLQRLLPDIRITEDESEIIIKENREEYSLKTALVKEAWKQNPEHDTLPINLQASRERLHSAVYHYALSVCKSGTKVVLKRALRDIFVNNYNAHWMISWDGNMDIQPCLDYFSVITYMTDYVCKAETKTTEVLKHVKKAKQIENVSNREMMYALAQAYLTSREMGECEAYYKLDSI
jgi:hypothetical protein